MHQNYLDQIDNDIAAKHLLKHPFYLAWTRGELSREALADYARQYYQHVAAFPTYLSAIHAKCDDQSTRKELLNNLMRRGGWLTESSRALAQLCRRSWRLCPGCTKRREMA